MDEVFAQVAENILNPNTDPTEKRGIQINLKFSPSKNRQLVTLEMKVTPKLAAAELIETQMMMGFNYQTGGVEVSEYDGQIKGQMSLDEIMRKEPEPTYKELTDEVQPETIILKKNKEMIPGKDFNPETGEIFENKSKLTIVHEG